jgi:lipopolysaccharide biosynthesis glycosyltransferase
VTSDSSPDAPTLIGHRPIIATVVDDAYVLPLRVMLASLLERLDLAVRPLLYVLTPRGPDERLSALGTLLDTRVVHVDEDVCTRLPEQHGFPPLVAFPLLLADVLPRSVERVLFLDPDLLVLDDIAKIWNVDLGAAVLAAVADQAIPRCGSPRGVKDCLRLGVPDDAPYFNAGVMLIDLPRWRSRDVSSRALSYLRDHRGRTDFFHQEALNAALWNDWRPLDPRWNLIASIAGRPYDPQRRTAPTDPGIVHFAGPFKPWRIRTGGPFAAQYGELAARQGGGAPGRRSLDTRLFGFYDRYLRTYLYPCERVLWNNRLI